MQGARYGMMKLGTYSNLAESSGNTFICDNEIKRSSVLTVSVYLWPGHCLHIIELLPPVENTTPVTTWRLLANIAWKSHLN